MKLALVGSLLLCATSLPAQTTLRGFVISPDSTPLPAVQLQLTDAAGSVRYEAMSDSTGRFEFTLGDDAPGGTYSLSASLIGYHPVTNARIRIEEDEVVVVRLRLHPNAVLLDPIEVVARVQPESPVITDYRRRAERIKATGMGRLLERAELERSAGLSFPRVLTSRVAGLQVNSVRMSNGMIVEMLTARGGCRPAVLLDRLPVPADALETIHVAALEGVEIYRDITEVPGEFSSYASGCGLIMAWTAEQPGRPFTVGRILMILGLVGGLFLLTR